jgi:hypothetical protein
MTACFEILAVTALTLERDYIAKAARAMEAAWDAAGRCLPGWDGGLFAAKKMGNGVTPSFSARCILPAS